MTDVEKSKKRLIGELQRRKNNYIATYKKIKRLLESAAVQKTFEDATKDRFLTAALDNNKAHKEFREFLLPFFSETAIRDVFPEEALAEQNENLKGAVQELQRNKNILDDLVQELSDKCTLQNEKLLEHEKLKESISDLQKQLEDCKIKNAELSKLIDVNNDITEKRMRKHSENRNEQQDLLIRDLEHRISFRQKGQENGSRRDHYISQSLGKIYKINEDLDGVAIRIKDFVSEEGDGRCVFLKETLVENLRKLDGISSDTHMVVRNERLAVIQKAQTLLDRLNSKCF